MSSAPDTLAELRQALQRGHISQAVFDAACAALAAQAAQAKQASQQGTGAIAQGPGSTALGAGAVGIGGNNSGLINLGLLIQQAGQPGAGEPELRRAYLARVLERANPLPLLAGKADGEQVLLSQVYTALLTSAQRQRDGQVLAQTGVGPDRQPRDLPGHDLVPASALEVLNAAPRLVLLGGPGSGKSSFANIVALTLAGEALGHPQINLALLTQPVPRDDDSAPDDKTPPPAQPWQHGALLPVPVLLRDFAANLPAPGTPADAETLWAFIAGRLAPQGLADYAPHLRQHLLCHGGLVLLDGLDEVPDAQGRRLQIKQAVLGFAATFGRCRYLATSRTYAYQRQDWKLDGFAEVQLLPFGPAQMQRFISAWFGQMVALQRLSDSAGARLADALAGQVLRNPRLRELAERPLLLTLIAQLHTQSGGALPEQREALYDQAVTMLLDTWERMKPGAGPDGQARPEPSLAEWLNAKNDDIRRQLDRLAFEAHRDQPDRAGTADIPQARLVQALLDASPRPDVQVRRLEAYLRDRAGLLSAHGVGMYQFPHRTIQEYLAACHLTKDGFPDKLAGLARTDPNRWREVALLAAAKAARGSPFSAWALVEELCPAPPPAGGGPLALASPAVPLLAADAWGALLAGQVLVEATPLADVARRDQPKRDRVRDWQVALLRSPVLPAAERALAGRSLAALGDPRPGVMTLDAMQFVMVPPGPFWMGDDRDDDAKPCHRVDMDDGFAIGRWPVTAAQWREYQARSGRVGAGADARHGRDNEPVVNVSWHEALGFCVWLTQAWAAHLPAGWVVTLPSEAEWEKAARGGEQVPSEPRPFVFADAVQALQACRAAPSVANPLPRRAFPWGDGFDAERANVQKMLGEPSALAAFGGGRSPVGAEDISGNVWQWTRSLWGKRWQEPQFTYPYRVDDLGRENLNARGYVRRVVRGGSWNFSLDS